MALRPRPETLEPGLLSEADRRRLRATKYPPEFDVPVDMKQVNIDVAKVWIAKEILNMVNGDDIVAEYIVSLFEQSDKPDIKAIQIQLEGFLPSAKLAAKFCRHLWRFLLDAQKSPSGIPPQLIDLKKQEMQALAERKSAASAERPEAAKVSKLDEIRARERKEREERLKAHQGRASDRGPGRDRGRYERGPRTGETRERADYYASENAGQEPRHRGDRSPRGRDGRRDDGWRGTHGREDSRRHDGRSRLSESRSRSPARNRDDPRSSRGREYETYRGREERDRSRDPVPDRSRRTDRDSGRHREHREHRDHARDSSLDRDRATAVKSRDRSRERPREVTPPTRSRSRDRSGDKSNREASPDRTGYEEPETGAERARDRQMSPGRVQRRLERERAYQEKMAQRMRPEE